MCIFKGRVNLIDYCQTCQHHTVKGCTENENLEWAEITRHGYMIDVDSIEKYLKKHDGVSREGIFDFLYPDIVYKGRYPNFKGSNEVRRQITMYMNDHPEWVIESDVHNKTWRRKKTISQELNNIVA